MQGRHPLPRDQWLKEAERCESEGSPRTSEAIIKATVGMDIEEEDKLENGDRLFMVDLDDEKERQIRAITREGGPDFVSEFKDVFSAQEFDQLPQHRSWDHAIDLTEGFKPTDCKIYPLSKDE